MMALVMHAMPPHGSEFACSRTVGGMQPGVCDGVRQRSLVFRDTIVGSPLWFLFYHHLNLQSPEHRAFA